MEMLLGSQLDFVHQTKNSLGQGSCGISWAPIYFSAKVPLRTKYHGILLGRFEEVYEGTLQLLLGWDPEDSSRCTRKYPVRYHPALGDAILAHPSPIW